MNLWLQLHYKCFDLNYDGWLILISSFVLYVATFWTNPQYRVKIVDPDSDDDDGNGSIIIGLMQKERRKLKKEGKGNLSIGYAVYKASHRMMIIIIIFVFHDDGVGSRDAADDCEADDN